jgi:hypothetical protein
LKSEEINRFLLGMKERYHYELKEQYGYESPAVEGKSENYHGNCLRFRNED